MSLPLSLAILRRPSTRALWYISIAICALTTLLLYRSLFINATAHTTFAGLSSEQIIELEGLSIGEAFTSLGHGNNTTAWLIEALKERFRISADQAAVDHPLYPTCDLNIARYERTALAKSTFKLPGLQRQGVVSIAINLTNSSTIIPAQAVALLEAASFLLHNNKVFISIYENGSEDNSRELLADFVAAAQALGIDGIWVLTSRMDTSKSTDRIVMLAEIRNHALAPLLPYAGHGHATTLIFLNDVVTCASDILELVHQQRLQKADMVMGMDWGVIDGDLPSAQARLYDMWVARGINGDLFYEFSSSSGFVPFTAHEAWVNDTLLSQAESVHERWLQGRPIPVYSGWGGMAAFDASLFTKEHLRFRSSILSGWRGGSASGALGTWGLLISLPGYLESDCPGASECEYISRDIWNMKVRRARIVLAPQARTAYDVDDWEAVRDKVPVVRHNEASSRDDLIDWEQVNPPNSVDCVATRTEDGEYIHTWDDKNERKRLDPIFHS